MLSCFRNVFPWLINESAPGLNALGSLEMEALPEPHRGELPSPPQMPDRCPSSMQFARGRRGQAPSPTALQGPPPWPCVPNRCVLPAQAPHSGAFRCRARAPGAPTGISFVGWGPWLDRYLSTLTQSLSVPSLPLSITQPSEVHWMVGTPYSRFLSRGQWVDPLPVQRVSAWHTPNTGPWSNGVPLPPSWLTLTLLQCFPY